MSGRVWVVTLPPVVFQCRLQKLRVSPVASQCGADSTKFLQWHSSVGLFQLSFSSGVPVYPATIRWVGQWYPSLHRVNQWHSSGIPVYTGPASVHWLRVRVSIVSRSLTRIWSVSYIVQDLNHRWRQLCKREGNLHYYGTNTMLGRLCSTWYHMMTSSNGNIFRVTGHLCGEFTGLRWIPRTKASDAELWYFLWSASE